MDTQSITVLLQKCEAGSSESFNAVFESCYESLKIIAAAQLRKLPSNGTVTPTVLMHECYLKFMHKDAASFKDSKHFMCALGQSMRHYLIDVYRAKNRQKRHSNHYTDKLTQQVGEGDIAFDLMDLEKVFQRIEKFNPDYVRLFELKVFMGLSVPELSKLLDQSERTIIRNWSHIKALLAAMLKDTK